MFELYIAQRREPGPAGACSARLRPTTSGRAYPWRIHCRFQNRSGYIVLDQLRTVDRERLVKRLGRLTAATLSEVIRGLQEMFAE